MSSGDPPYSSSLKYSSVSATSASVYTRSLPSLQKVCAIPLATSAQLKSHWESQELLPSRPQERTGNSCPEKRSLVHQHRKGKNSLNSQDETLLFDKATSLCKTSRQLSCLEESKMYFNGRSVLPQFYQKQLERLPPDPSL